jgi:Tfp pilus assembly protein PilX
VANLYAGRGREWSDHQLNRGQAVKLNHFRKTTAHAQSGQVMLFTLLALGLFLLGAIAFAVDMSALWFQRQTAQTAADAACTAGAMDWLKVQTNNISVAPYPGNFTPGNNFDCNSTTPNSNGSGTTNPAPCVYAAFNGYVSSLNQSQAAAGTLGDNVSVRFDGAAPPGVTSTSVMEVDITQNIPTFFLGLLRGRTTQTVTAIAKCGVQQVASPIPLIVLDPVNPDSKTSAFDISGTPTVTIYGGPQQSIQINSGDVSAVNINGSALVDLSQGGPASPPTGSNFGVYGGPIQPPSCAAGSGFCGGTTGSWMSPHAQIQDPLQNLPVPSKSGLTRYNGPFRNDGTGTGSGIVADGASGCSGSGGASCVVFSPGYYPNGICLGTSCPGSKSAQFATFVEGLYYLEGDLTLNADSCVRMSTSTGPSPYNGWGGAIFYFSKGAALNVTANAGQPPSGCDANFPFNVASGGPTGNGVYCDANAASHGPANLPASTSLTGNVFLAPCFGTAGATGNPYGDPFLANGQTPPSNPGTQRGILFFQDRSDKGVQANAGGGGSYAMAGTFYFHSCSSSSNGTSCVQPTGTTSQGGYYNNSLIMQGNPGAQSYILGEIIVDNLSMGGKPKIFMDLNPTSAQNILKASLYQ